MRDAPEMRSRERAERVRERPFRPPFSSDLCFSLLSFLRPIPLPPIDDVPLSVQSYRRKNPNDYSPPPPPITLCPFTRAPSPSPINFPCDITSRPRRGSFPLRWPLRAPIESRGVISFFFLFPRPCARPKPRFLTFSRYLLLVDSLFGFPFYFILFFIFCYFHPHLPPPCFSSCSQSAFCSRARPRSRRDQPTTRRTTDNVVQST